MMISTKSNYALRVMIDLAENNTGSYVAMKNIADRQGISLKYLEKILPCLVKAELIEGVHGKGGGYRLTKNPEDYKISEILSITEGDLAPVPCLEKGAEHCKKTADCRTLPLWSELSRVVYNYLDSVTIADLMKSS